MKHFLGGHSQGRRQRRTARQTYLGRFGDYQFEPLESRLLLNSNPIIDAGVSVGTVSQLVEISGVAASRSLAGNLWVHQDSGDTARFYGLNPSGAIHSIITLSGAPAVDWEDMAIGPKPGPGGGNYLYFGDIGDNSANRFTGVDIIRVTEPTATGNTTTDQYTVKRVLYPGIAGFSIPKNAESLFVDPLTSDLYIITKQSVGGIYRLPASQFDLAGSSPLESLGNINATLNNPTSADISPDGKFIIVRNSGSGGVTSYLFQRGPGQSVADALHGTPTTHTLRSEPQGEAIGWNPDGSGFYSISEGTNRPIWLYTFDTLPTDVSAGGPYTIAEGAGLTLTASASGIGPLSYSWDVNNDGIFGDATGSNPTVNWTQLQAIGINDGPGTRNVRVRVDNGAHPAVVSSSTTLTITNVAPTADAGGPYTINEGDGLNLAGSASDPVDGLTISWDLNGDNVFGDAAGASPSLTWAQLVALGINDGPGSFNVKLRADDGDGGITDSTATLLTVDNASPTADAGGPYAINGGDNLNLNASASSDPSPVDVLSYSWDVNGDNTFGDATGVSPTLTPGQQGSLGITPGNMYSVRVRVDDGNATTTSPDTTLTVNVSPGLDLDGVGGDGGFTSTWHAAGAVNITDSDATLTDDGANLTSLAATLSVNHTGDVLAANNSTHPGISVVFSTGTLTLSGSASISDYQDVLRTITYNNTVGHPLATSVAVNIVANDGVGNSNTAVATINIANSTIPSGGRQLFYNQSKHDGNNAAVTAADDTARATDKTPYIPGTGTATFANISSYSKGINGIMIDISKPHGPITAADFEFKIGNNNTPGSWNAPVPTPTSITVRAGAGIDGSDRVEITWANGAIQKKWLEVIVKGNDTLGSNNLNTGLAVSDVHFWGSAPGDTGDGDTATRALVNATDEIAVRGNPLFAGAGVANIYDIDRSGGVNATDQIIIRGNGTIAANATWFISVSGAGPFAPEGEVTLLPAATIDDGDPGSVLSGLVANSTASAWLPRIASQSRFSDVGSQSKSVQAASVSMLFDQLEQPDAQIELVIGDDITDLLDNELLEALTARSRCEALESPLLFARVAR